MTIPSVKILTGDALAMLRTLPDASVDCCVTSPPYWGLRDYGIEGQIGREDSPEAFAAALVLVFREVRRVLKDEGTLWMNLGDSYASAWPCSRVSAIGNGSLENGKRENRPPRLPAGLKEKDLIGIPWRVAFALQADGWFLRSDIIWAKPNCMPESVTDRPTRSHEYIFLLSKSRKYFYDADAIKEPCSESTEKRVAQDLENQAESARANGGAKTNGTMKAVVSKQRGHSRRHEGFNARWDQMEKSEQCSGVRNKRDVWTVSPAQYAEAHFATFPPALITPCVLAGCSAGGTVLDPFAGSGTTGQVAIENGRNFVGIELNPAYVKLMESRLFKSQPGFAFSPTPERTVTGEPAASDLQTSDAAEKV
jgi:DNA modification methylase